MNKTNVKPHHQLPTPGAPWIKVCGVRSYADLEACARAGATHAGLNAWPGSARFVAPFALSRLIGAARSLCLSPVVVHLPGSPVTLEEAALMGAAFLQVLDPPPPSLRRKLAEMGSMVIEARRTSPANVARLPWADVLLIDAFADGRPGGTGVKVSEALCRAAPRPFVLAGGLNPDNVAAIIAAAKPAGVDAASGLEGRPGEKDPVKIRDYCIAAREALGRARRET